MASEATPKLAFVDVESTGLDSRVHRPWEVAIIRREAGMPDEEHVFQIRPDLTVADPEALKSCRFQERFDVPEGWDAVWSTRSGVRWRMKAHEAVTEIQSMLSDTYLVAANPAFDDGMLKALMWDHERRIRWHYRLMCVESLVAGALRLPVPVGLRKSADLLGVRYEAERLHEAMIDARLCRDVYDAVMAGGAR